MAVADTEAALRLNPPVESLLMQIKSNLGYYYAELKLQGKKDIALSYTKEALDLYPKYGVKALSWVVNYQYVRIAFADTLKEIDEAIHYLEWLKKEQPSLSEEIDAILKGAHEKRKTLNKN
jgi:tetratricopeptide (TPR) repeat protein